MLHERKSRYIQISKLKSGEAVWTTYHVVEKLMKDAVKTLTVDRGSEFAYWETIEKRLGIKMYMTDSYSAWQK